MESKYLRTGNRLPYRETACMKRLRLKPLLIGLTVLLLIVGLVVQQIHQEAKDRALIAAIRQLDQREVTRLLSEGADANAVYLPPGRRSLWPIFWYMTHRWPRKQWDRPALMIAFFAVDGASSYGNYGKRPADLFPIQSHIVRTLLEHGARVMFVNEGMHYPLLITAAEFHTDPDVFQAMLDKGAEINTPWPESGQTALMVAADAENVSSLRFLLMHRANVTIKDYEGHTALYHALYPLRANGAIEDKVIQMLHDAGAR